MSEPIHDLAVMLGRNRFNRDVTDAQLAQMAADTLAQPRTRKPRLKIIPTTSEDKPNHE